MRLVLLIAIKNLFGEKGRLIITIGGVAFSVALILVLLGLYQGWSRQMTRFLGNIPADFWVGQKGSRDMSHTVSILPSELGALLEKTDYVTSVKPFVGRQVSFEIDGKEAHLFFVGVDNDPIIKPYKLLEGRGNPASGEIVIDQAFANSKHLFLGDELEVNGVNLKIIGISSGGNMLVYTYSLVNLDNLRKISNFSQYNNYYLVKTDNQELAQKALKDNFLDLQILTKQEFLDNNAALVKDTFLPIIGVLFIISLAIGIAVIGLTIFTATIEKSREYGVLKAVGYTNGQLYLVALMQSLVAGLIGFLAGWGLSVVVAQIAKISTSAFIYELNKPEIAAVFVLAIIMSSLASLIPLKRLASIDPAQVFKA